MKPFDFTINCDCLAFALKELHKDTIDGRNLQQPSKATNASLLPDDKTRIFLGKI